MEYYTDWKRTSLRSVYVRGLTAHWMQESEFIYNGLFKMFVANLGEIDRIIFSPAMWTDIHTFMSTFWNIKGPQNGYFQKNLKFDIWTFSITSSIIYRVLKSHAVIKTSRQQFYLSKIFFITIALYNFIMYNSYQHLNFFITLCSKWLPRSVMHARTRCIMLVATLCNTLT